MWSSVKRFLPLLPLLGFVGCGYTLNHRLKDTFANSTGIFVPVFHNESEETGAEIVFTDALIREMHSHGESVLPNRDPSGLILKGDVISIVANPETYTGVGYQGLNSTYQHLPDQIGVNVAINFQLFKGDGKTMIWTKTFTGYRRVNAKLNRTYDVDAPSSFGLITQSVIDRSYPDIARDIMHDVYDDMVELL